MPKTTTFVQTVEGAGKRVILIKIIVWIIIIIIVILLILWLLSFLPEFLKNLTEFGGDIIKSLGGAAASATGQVASALGGLAGGSWSGLDTIWSNFLGIFGAPGTGGGGPPTPTPCTDTTAEMNHGKAIPCEVIIGQDRGLRTGGTPPSNTALGWVMLRASIYNTRDLVWPSINPWSQVNIPFVFGGTGQPGSPASYLTGTTPLPAGSAILIGHYTGYVEYNSRKYGFIFDVSRDYGELVNVVVDVII